MGNEHSKNKAEQAPEKPLHGGLNGHAVSISSNGLENVTSEAAVKQNSMPPPLPPSEESGIVEADGSGLGPVVVDQKSAIEKVPEVEPEIQNAKTQNTPEPELEPATQEKEEPKNSTKEKVNIFENLFKKKAKPQPTSNPDPAPEKEEPIKEKIVEEIKSSPEEVPVAVTDGIQAEPLSEVKEDTETSKERPNPSPEAEEVKIPKIAEESSLIQENQEGESQTEENPVMNFFKTLVTPTKKNKQGTATPDVAKDQKEAEPTTTTTTAAQVVDAPAAAKGGMSIPPAPAPAPAPAPPKMEVKAELAVQPVTNTPKEEPKGAAKEPEAAKPKSDRPFSRLFSRKALIGLKSKIKVKSTSGARAPAKPAAATVEPVEPQPVVEVQTVEPVEPQPVMEVQNVDFSKTATLEASATLEPPPPALEEEKTPAASKASPFTSFSLFKTKAAVPKKEAPAPAPAAEAVAVPSVAKDEPKATEAPAVDSKPVPGPSEVSENSPVLPKRLEKRNSIHLFFKNLGKRQSDAGVQTEPEKTK